MRAKRASKAPWLIKIGNPSCRENLVMTSAYDQASERTPSVKTLGVEEGRVEVSLTDDLYLSCQQTFGDVDLTFKIRKIEFI